MIAINAKRSSIKLILAITNQGKARFSRFEGTMNAKRLIGFMKGLIKDAKRKVYPILDNLWVHHANLVKEWLAKHSDETGAFYLPANSPELNPDEYLNCDLKAGVHGGAIEGSLKAQALAHMRRLQELPARVASYFEHRCIHYAA